jgi:hypothetical protein
MKTTKLVDWNRNHFYNVEATGPGVEWAICMLGFEILNDATDITPAEADIIRRCEREGADAPEYLRRPDSLLMWYVVDEARTGHTGLMSFTPERLAAVQQEAHA